MSEIPLPNGWQILVSLYGYFLPIMLYAAWATLGFWDLGRREGLSKGATIGWTAVILLVPFFGALAYHLIGGSTISKPLRTALVGGGLALMLVVFAIGSIVGGA
jgi:hypothetical protein